MSRFLVWFGRVAGIVGILLTGAAVAVRASGLYWIAGFQAVTIMQAGMAVMLMGCLALLAAVAK